MTDNKIAHTVVLIEGIQAGFFQILKASSKTLKGFFVTIFTLFVVGVLISMIIGGLWGFAEGFFEGIMSSKGNDMNATVLLASHLSSWFPLYFIAQSWPLSIYILEKE